MEAAQSILSIQGESIILSATKPRFIVRANESAEFNRYTIMSIGFLLVGMARGAVVGFAAFDAILKMSVIVAFFICENNESKGFPTLCLYLNLLSLRVYHGCTCSFVSNMAYDGYFLNLRNFLEI